MAKRTHTLKSIAARQSFDNVASRASEDLSEQIPLPSLDHLFYHDEHPSQCKPSSNAWHSLLLNELGKAAQLLALDPAELQLWLEPYHSVPAPVCLSLLRIITNHRLDPLLEEVSFVQHEQGHWQASITINGWSKIANRCHHFAGIQFCESLEESDHEAPLWMECTIYRTDRTTPITVREYFSEVKKNTEIWQKMPRRMLRNRTFQQCARLAFGL